MKPIKQQVLWNLYPHLAKDIHRHLLAFRKMKLSGYPGDMSMAQWHKILDDMILGFLYLSNDDHFYGDTIFVTEKSERQLRKIERHALSLFAKYFKHLWS